MKRNGGILMSISSLPSNYGIGTLGKAAYDYADFLKASGQHYWQMLPLGPTSYGDSPYSSLSSYAGNIYFIDLDMLIADGLLLQKEVDAEEWGTNPRYVDYGKIYTGRYHVLEIAKKRGWERDQALVDAFVEENKRWLPNYALYMACKRHFGMKAWTEWEDEAIRKRSSEAVLNKYREMLKEDVEFFTYMQYLFYKQWDALKQYIHELGLEIIGDVPIYVALDSADVWSEPENFQLDDEFVPKEVSGVPPDYFSEDGQLWGNPLYDWDYMTKDGYGWWIRRIDGAGKLFDVIRIDHFRGFDTYWAVPYGETTAKKGKWRQGPGMKLVSVLNTWFTNLTYIAEDLGTPTPTVTKLLKDSNWPGMKVLEFAFDHKEPSSYLTHEHTRHCICYTGTHDNAPILEWVDDQDPEDIAYMVEYFGANTEEGMNWVMIRGGMRSTADLFIAQMQDYLGLGKYHRMNTPGVAVGNWQWRLLEGEASEELAEKIKKMSLLYGRTERPAKVVKAEEETAEGKTVEEKKEAVEETLASETEAEKE